MDLQPQQLERFRQLLLDYEIIQPFAQLDRPIFRLDERERDAAELERFRGRMLVASGRRKLIGAAGWQNGVGASMLKPVGARHVLLRFIEHGAKKRPAAVDEVTSLTLLEGPEPAPFGRLSDVEASELLRDVESLPRA